MVVTLGPTSMAPVRGLPKNPRPDGTGYNPRCLRRDINRNAAMGATADRAYSLIQDNNDVNGFYNQLLGTPPPKNDPYPWGVSLSPPRLNNMCKNALGGKKLTGVDPHGWPLYPRRRPGR